MALDAECELENVHVYYGITDECTQQYGFFVASMTLVDISNKKNSYCRIQLLESDDKNR